MNAVLRGLVQSIILGDSNGVIHRWLKKLVMLAPPVKAAGMARRGDIYNPLGLLERFSLGGRDAVALKRRLKDMAEFLESEMPETGDATGGIQPVSSQILYAFHSCGAFDPSGYTSRSVALLGSLGLRGINPTVAIRPGYPWDLAKHRKRNRVNSVEYQGIEFLLCPDARVSLHTPESEFINAYAEHLSRLVAQKQLTLIHSASNYLNGMAAALAGRKSGVPSVYELRGLWHLTKAFYNPAYGDSDHYRYCEKREVLACLAVDRVITISDGLRDWLVSKGVPEQKISVVGNATFNPVHAGGEEAQAGQSIRRRFGIPEQARVLGYLGSIVEYEGLESVIRAHAKNPEGQRPYLLIVGSGKHEAALRDLVQRMGTGGQTVFAGRVGPEEVSSCYAAMDAIALPREDHELTRIVPAIKPFEVLAHDKPLIVSPPLAKALGSTLPTGFKVADFAEVKRLDLLLDAALAEHSSVSVPTWFDRAGEIIKVYEDLGYRCTGVSQ